MQLEEQETEPGVDEEPEVNVTEEELQAARQRIMQIARIRERIFFILSPPFSYLYSTTTFESLSTKPHLSFFSFGISCRK